MFVIVHHCLVVRKHEFIECLRVWICLLCNLIHVDHEEQRTIGINEAYITILEDIYTGAAARVHMDNQISEKISILRGLRQGDPIFTKLFTATVQEVCKNAQPEEKGIKLI